MIDAFRIKLGNKIKQIRESKGLSREDVALASDFSGSYMGMMKEPNMILKFQNYTKLHWQ